MNGMFNNNFVVGMLLARDLPKQDQLMTGLAAGQMPASSALGPILLKPMIDARLAAESGRTSAETETTALRQPLEIELAGDSRTVTLRVPSAPGTTFSASDGATVDASGKVELAPTTPVATITIAAGGVVRQVTVRAAAAVGTGGNGGASGGASAPSSRRSGALGGNLTPTPTPATQPS